MPFFNIVAQTNESTVVTEYEPVARRSDAYQSEADLEKEFIRMLTEQGYTYLQIHSESELVANLRSQLEELNGYKFTDNEWNRFFSDSINDIDDVIAEWNEFVYKEREKDLKKIIDEERLKYQETRKFIENCFREGEIKVVGTDIDNIMPPISRFGGGRLKKKQEAIDKLRAFFEKYNGIGSTNFVAEENSNISYLDDNLFDEPVLMVAEEEAPYGSGGTEGD